MAWDVSRRTVMSGGAVGAAVAGLGIGRSALAKRPLKIIVIEEAEVPESRLYAETFVNSGRAAKVIRIDRTLNGLLHELVIGEGVLVGLTSDPAAMIAEQVLLADGARPLLKWAHHYRKMRWEHRTDGAPALLARASTGWPTVLANHMQDALGGSRQAPDLRCQSGHCGLDGKSPGMLVSWAFEVGVQQS
ncbi:hypothetical protein OLX02_16125 [Novosphingobium sp. KCTC 2891]|uniref:hypothetical protein n=1 Tax=Novosphingobium sp. KCTC 2891 TaxID=2989730 RepID=UPI00222235BB|nr:hypothetical protein [Novosphingobium sp. KCTC 2891]MCW1384349.1 hypothetical protein [Novosphingobium sp. KCTC 2891]